MQFCCIIHCYISCIVIVMTKNINQLKQKLLFSVLENLPYELMDSNLIANSCKYVGMEKHYANLLFPGGNMQLLQEFRDYIDNLLICKIDEELKDTKGITNRIHLAICMRFELLKKYKMSVSKISSYFAFPWNHMKLYQYTWHSMNLIWRYAGYDKSTNFNYYTKRCLLTGVYCSSLIYWLNDESPDSRDTFDFVKRELYCIVGAGKKIGELKSKFC